MRIRQLVVGAALALCVGAPAAAQRGTGTGPLHYDTSTVQTVSGTIDQVRSSARGAVGVEVMLLTGGDSLVVHLGPARHLERNGVRLAKGDRVDVTGSKITIAGRPALVAREITKGGKTVKLRDERGMPLWTPSRSGSS